MTLDHLRSKLTYRGHFLPAKLAVTLQGHGDVATHQSSFSPPNLSLSWHSNVTFWCNKTPTCLLQRERLRWSSTLRCLVDLEGSMRKPRSWKVTVRWQFNLCLTMLAPLEMQKVRIKGSDFGWKNSDLACTFPSKGLRFDLFLEKWLVNISAPCVCVGSLQVLWASSHKLLFHNNNFVGILLSTKNSQFRCFN